MVGWRKHRGRAALLAMSNIDTDQLIPARFMSTPRSAGYGTYLLHDLRRTDTGALDAGFALNAALGASVLVAGDNFGCGSSREAAVYALVDAGFRAVLAPSFGDIFASNAVNNGLLPAQIDAAIFAKLQSPRTDFSAVTIDLDTYRATFGQDQIQFALEDTWRTKLINGWDDIDLTQAHSADIAAYRSTYHTRNPWAAIPPRD
ncbi:MAG: 3-isopropylmalate dehydratase small subunit [Paracoccaceae bacterium]